MISRISDPVSEVIFDDIIDDRCLCFALAGQPNVGKSTIFNLLTGKKQHTGNWPGKTIECQVGTFNYWGTDIHLVDLPGSYSLTAHSDDERVARDFIIKEHPDVIIVILNAATLERDLYLISELLWFPVPMVIGVNMMDVAKQQGFQIETRVLEATINIPIIPMIASKGSGVHELIDTAISLAHHKMDFEPTRAEIRADHSGILEEITVLISPYVPEPYPIEWVALKLLEGDEEILSLLQFHMEDSWKYVEAILIKHEDAALAIACGRYDWIGRMVRAAVIKPKAGQISMTDKIDHYATHPVWGMAILFAVLSFTFFLTFTIGVPIQNWLDQNLVQKSAVWVKELLVDSPAWIQGLIVNGLISGVGTVLTLLPILIIFFAVMGFLEDFGYMARTAYVMDRFMHFIGLHGKSFLPLFIGFGCNVPAVMGSRIIEDHKARLATILITPLVPCTARLAVIAFLTPIFFGKSSIWVAMGLVVLSMVILLFVGMILHNFFFGGEHKAFIMELPLYHTPNFRIIWRSVWQRNLDFLRTAGSIILVTSVVLWVLSTYPGGSIHTSFLAMVGRLLAPIGSWMGLDWRMMVALLTSFVRKENTIPTLAVLFGTASQTTGMASALSQSFSVPAFLSFLSVQILFIPCLATVASIRQETGSWRWTLIDIFLILAVSLVIGIVVYHVAGFLIKVM